MTTPAATDARPLAGVRVLDLSRLLPGPFASLVLADLGATVDKVEDAGAGDYLRHFTPRIEDAAAPFHALNRGKRGLVLDLKKPSGRAALLRLLPHYDVLLEQFRPGVLARLGFGDEVLREAAPRLIVCSLTGYGQSGPLAARAGHDLNYLARSGLLGLQGPAGAAPAVPGWQLADVGGALWCVVAILAALRGREATGEGSRLDIAMLDGAVGFASLALAATAAGAPPPRGDDTLTGGLAPYNTYLAQDGAAFALGALEPKFWGAFCAGAGLTPVADDFVPGPHQAARKAEVAAIFAARPRDAWIAFAEAHDCCLEPVLSPGELASDPQIVARGLFFSLAAAGGAPTPQLRTPVTPRDADFLPAPRPGQHADEILREAGLCDDEIAALRREGALG